MPGVEARAGKFPGPSLIPALHAIQERVGWLPREELVTLSRDVRRPLYEIEGLISFYPHFRTGPPVKVEVHACHDLPAGCRARTADRRTAGPVQPRRRRGGHRGVLPRPVRRGPRRGGQREPGRRRRTGALIGAARSGDGGGPTPPLRRRRAVAERPLRRRARSGTGCCARYCPGNWTPNGSSPRLRTRGCAAWAGPASRPAVSGSWSRRRPAKPKYAICNADESEPGTFKDRQILAEQPHLVLEGLLLGMVAVGAEEGWVFIRHEYGPEEAVIRREIESLRAGAWSAPTRGQRPAALGRGVHLTGRLHPRRGVGADRVHGRPPRRAAQQAAVPRHLRPVGQADADELGGDVRARPGHRRARRPVVADAG